MKIYSFTREGFNLVPFEVEVNFLPGLPSIQIIGQADQIIKESQLRIKSAIQNQGFTYPKAKQIIVNLKPSYLKKKSQGLDLAIACAYLVASKQVKVSVQDSIYIYGELGLDGRVFMPEDFDLLDDYSDQYLLTGESKKPSSQSYFCLQQLKDLEKPTFQKSKDNLSSFKRPRVKDIYITASMAELLKIISVGEHSVLLAGPAGSGKSTFAELINSFIREPGREQAFEITKISRLFKQNQSWRPFVVPHHTTPKISMVGGGQQLAPGEITRAHNGILLLDELLEFSSQVKESLREPIEKGCIHIARSSQYHKFPSDFLLLSTTNLCPCGDMVPGRYTNCRFSLRKCQSYIEKLSGPLLDRFQILNFSYDWLGEKSVFVPDLLTEVLEIQNFTHQQKRKTLNSKLAIEDIYSTMNERSLKMLSLKEFRSHRRRLALLKVARTVADINLEKTIKYEHIKAAEAYTERPFVQLKNIFAE